MNGQPDIIARATARIRECRAEQPDLPLTVLLPHARLVPLFTKARLGPCLRYLTLTAWAEQQELPPEYRITSSLERLSLVYQALRERGWFIQQDRWALAQEALKWVDELTSWGFVAPANLEEFTHTLAAAYDAGLSEPLLFEARFILDLWQVLSATPLEPSEKMARQYRLSQAVKNAPPGHYLVIDIGQLQPYESKALADLASIRSVEWLCSETLINTHHPVAPLLECAWERPISTPLLVRAGNFSQAYPDTPFGDFQIIACTSLEQEARSGCAQILKWRENGHQEIALVAQDRVVARRLRALLAESGVPVFDESGWVFSTTAASTVVMRLLELFGPQGNYRTLEDLLHSPYLLPGWSPEKLNLARETLRTQIHQANWLGGLDRLTRLSGLNTPSADGSLEAALELALLLNEQNQLFQGPSRPLITWMESLQVALAQLGILEGLQSDQAGSQLQDILGRFQENCTRAHGRYSLGEFTRILDHHFENCPFMEEELAGAVRLTQLSLTRLRSFDAVLMVGADSAHLPALPNFPFFGDSVRQALGLPGREIFVLAAQEELGSLISRTSRMVISWQKEQGGEPNALATSLLRLEVFHQSAYGTSLIKVGQPSAFASENTPPLNPPSPQAPELVPDSLSASALNTLLACPYRYFAGQMLGLDPERGVRETLDKRDYGNTVHRILQRFHRKHPILGTLGRENALTKLETLSRELFLNQGNDPEQRAWCLRWLDCIEPYVDWCLEQEELGWYWHEAESSPPPVSLPLADGSSLLLKGRLDRVDRQRNGSLRILDYKLKDSAALKREQELGEDEQLPFYGLLYPEASEAAFLPLEGDAIKPIFCEPLRDRTELTSGRIKEIFSSIRQGSGLTANGTPKACNTCAYAGLCRLNWWESP